MACFPWLSLQGEAAEALTLEARGSELAGSFLTLFVGKHHATKTEVRCKDTVVLLKLPLKREYREISLRAANNPVVKEFDQPGVSPRTPPSPTHAH